MRVTFTLPQVALEYRQERVGQAQQENTHVHPEDTGLDKHHGEEHCGG